MTEPFMGEIRMLAFDYAPRDWALCNGQFLPINQNQALFSLLGTTYGGNGQTTFALPDLRGRVPMHSEGSSSLGEIGGQLAHTLIASELPVHNHLVNASTAAVSAPSPVSGTFGTSTQNPYSPTANAALLPSAVAPIGGSQPHTNMSPYSVITFAIALFGIFPSPN